MATTSQSLLGGVLDTIPPPEIVQRHLCGLLEQLRLARQQLRISERAHKRLALPYHQTAPAAAAAEKGVACAG